VQRFTRFVQLVDRACQAVVAALVCAIVAVVFAQVIFRYAVVRPLFWGDELARYLFIWISFLGAAVAMGSRLHYGFDYLMEKSPAALRGVVGILTSLLAVGFFLVCLVYGVQSIAVVSAQRSPALQISMAWVYAALPTGSVLMLLHLVDQMLPSAGKYGVEGVA
jgi:TRAP-type C4-dicarboxylate transport system permease small subunit